MKLKKITTREWILIVLGLILLLLIAMDRGRIGQQITRVWNNYTQTNTKTE